MSGSWAKSLPDQSSHNLGRLGQRAIERARVASARLCQVRPSAALAADQRRKCSHNLPCVDLAGQVLRDANDQRNFAIGRSTQKHHATAQLAAHLVHQIAHRPAFQSIDALHQQLNSFDFDRACVSRRSTRRLHPRRIQLSPQLLHLLFVRRDPCPQRIRQCTFALPRCLRSANDLPDHARNFKVPPELAQRAPSAHRLHAPHAARYRPFAH